MMILIRPLQPLNWSLAIEVILFASITLAYPWQQFVISLHKYDDNDDDCDECDDDDDDDDCGDDNGDDDNEILSVIASINCNNCNISSDITRYFDNNYNYNT